MYRHICLAILTLVLIVSISGVAQSQQPGKPDAKQENMKQEKGQKHEMKKEAAMGSLKSVSCDPKCGFMVRSHDEKEVSAVIKEHAKKMHNMDMTDKQVKDMMKSEETPAKKD